MILKKILIILNNRTNYGIGGIFMKGGEKLWKK